MKRLSGLDFFRVLAALGVVLIHAGITVDNSLSVACLGVSGFFSFVVPFFVCASLALSLRGATLPWGDWLKKTSTRLLLPYLAWSAIYLGLRLIRYMHTPEIALADPVGLLFFTGGGGLALYFIPMLFVGLCVAHGLKPLLDALKAHQVLALGLAVLAYGLLFALSHSGNAYDLANARSFQRLFPGQSNEFLRLALGFLAHAIYALPHIFVVVLAWQLWEARQTRVLGGVGALLFIAPLFLFGGDWLTGHVRGDGAFFLALSLSPWLASAFSALATEVLSRLAACTFGVFLSHQLVLQVLQVIFRKILPADAVFGPLFITVQSLIVFAFLCLAIHLLAKRFAVLRWLLAVR